jgi:hypothetical protein
MFKQLRRAAATMAVAVVILTPSSLQAQAIFGAAEFDDENTSFFMLGGTMGLGSGMGWRPFVGLTAYHLRFEGLGTTDRNVIVPSLGMSNTSATGSYGGSLGYAFADEDAPVAFVGAESGDGVVLQGHWNHWGTTGRHAFQWLGSYNFGSEFFWTRGRASKPLTATSPLWVGGEAALMGGNDVTLAQLGPTIEWRFNPQFRLGGSAGFKPVLSGGSGSAVYGRLEFLWLPRAR